MVTGVIQSDKWPVDSDRLTRSVGAPRSAVCLVDLSGSRQMSSVAS